MYNTTDDSVRNDIIGTLKYFHIFRHPLTAEEIYRFSKLSSDKIYHQKVLNDMINEGVLSVSKGYYRLCNHPDYADRRIEGIKRAEKLMAKALVAARRISSFPFVKSVCISGSLSKGYANEKSDIDFFIITSNKRLWVARSLLHCYKKFTFLWGDQHSFCMNYFIDESKMCIEEQNIFTATEMATLLPVYGQSVYHSFIKANEKLLSETFPNVIWEENPTLAERKHKVKIAAESLLNIMFPEALNNFLMRFTDKWWRFKWERKGYPMHDYDLAMKTRWYVSKNHPLNFQHKVLKHVADDSTAREPQALEVI
ncbi:MAG: nucleotidyltransferase domain-containing protein [Bacteroidetes bacterium]|nr:nucleotidyltransferase domain-containing protein [Bacteroidota bacterium]